MLESWRYLKVDDLDASNLLIKSVCQRKMVYSNFYSNNKSQHTSTVSWIAFRRWYPKIWTARVENHLETLERCADTQISKPIDLDWVQQIYLLFNLIYIFIVDQILGSYSLNFDGIRTKENIILLQLINRKEEDLSPTACLFQPSVRHNNWQETARIKWISLINNWLKMYVLSKWHQNVLYSLLWRRCNDIAEFFPVGKKSTIILRRMCTQKLLFVPFFCLFLLKKIVIHSWKRHCKYI